MRNPVSLLLAVLLPIVLSSAPSAQSGARYTIVPVGDFNPQQGSSASDVNNANQVVGSYTQASGDVRAFLHTGGMNIDLGTLGGRYTNALAINDAGVITGFSAFQPATMAPSHAFRYDAGTMTDLGTLGGSSSIGAAINNAGYITGPSTTSSNNWEAAFIWNGSTIASLATAGWSAPFSTAINASTTIVGDYCQNGYRAFRYAAGGITDRGTLPGDAGSAARSVNDAGLTVGSSKKPWNAGSTAVQWSNGTITALPSLPGATWSEADDVNAGGEIVGASNGRAVRWSGGTIVDLNTEIPAGSGWTLEAAYAINDGGAIVGSGIYNGVMRGFLLIQINDTTPPSISCGSAHGLWHAADVSIASDSGSGLANPADASFSLSTSVAAGTETANASTGSRTVCDNAGNCAVAGPIAWNRIDRAALAIAISNPTAATYPFLSSQPAAYTCADGGSGVASCTGTAPGGSPIDTSTAGVRTFTVAAGDVVGNVSSATIQYTVVATNWPQFHNGANRSGLQRETVLDPTNVGMLALAWKAPTGNPIDASPVVVDGVVYIPSSDGHLYALSAASGAQLWAAPIGSFLVSTPAVVSGRVFAGSDDGNVYALDASTGHVLWAFQTKGVIYASPMVANGIVYIGSWDENLYALDAATGTLVWSQNFVYPVRGDAAYSNGVVYLANDGLYAVDAHTGAALWTVAKFRGAPVSSPAVGDGTVYIGVSDRNVYAFRR